jgi:hypothetical protein
MIKSKRVQVTGSNDFSTQSLGTILGVTLPFTKVMITPISGPIIIGDGNLSTSDYGAKFTVAGGRVLLEFDADDDPANNLFFRSEISQDDIDLAIMAW